MTDNTIFLGAYTSCKKSACMGKSMHLAIGDENGFIPLNYGIGVLFAEADMSRHDKEKGTTGTTIGMDAPWLFRMKDGKTGVIAVSTDNGSKGDLLFWTTDDLINYKAHESIKLNVPTSIMEPQCYYDKEKKIYRITYADDKGQVYANETTDFVTIGDTYIYNREHNGPFVAKGIDEEVSCLLAITEDEANRLKAKLGEFQNIGVKEIKLITQVGNAIDFETLPHLTALYSDNSEAEIPVKWSKEDYKAIDFNTPGYYQVNGEAVVKEYSYPMILERADPQIIYFDEKYYFIATNDRGQRNFFIRCSDSIEGLEDAEDFEILSPTESGDMSGCNWAPELHVIDGVLWLLFASGTNGRWNSVQSRMMRCKGNPLKAGDWEKPIRCLKKDRSFLCNTGITLDMTYFEHKGEHYVVWAEREVGVVSGKTYNDASDLMIGKIDPKQPWQLINDPVKICHPRYGWDRQTTEVNEGPYIIKHNDRIFMTYSGSGVDQTYTVGLLMANVDKDLCDVSSWEISGYPILASQHVEGQFGPGHNSFTVDEYGRDVFVFHAMSDEKGRRHMSVRTVHWAADGTPILHMTGERELKHDYRHVTAIIEIKGK